MKDHMTAKERLSFKEPLVDRFWNWFRDLGYDQKEEKWRRESLADKHINAIINNLELWGK